MIRAVSYSSSGLKVRASVDREPCIYLDSDSLFELAHNAHLNARFGHVFRTRGTLMLSWTNALEIGLRTGKGAHQVKALLNLVGRHWCPLQLNVYRAAEAEIEQGQSSHHPAISRTFIDAFVRNALASPGPVVIDDTFFALGRIVDFIDDDEASREDVRRFKSDLLPHFERLRLQSHGRDPGVRPRWNPLRRIGSTLAQALWVVRTEARSHRWTENDSLDFMHAVMALATCQIVLLDRQWARRAALFDLGSRPPRVFYRRQLPEVLDAIEA